MLRSVVTLYALLMSGSAFAEEFKSPISQCEVIGETQRVVIDNKAGGLIQGSRDGGSTWTTIGKVLSPINGDYWRPSQDGGVLAFDFLRGPSNVFAVAANNLHLRFSDPEGYKLPADVNVMPPPGRGFSISPADIYLAPTQDTQATSRVAMTNVVGGRGIFGPEWSPRIGDAVYVGDGVKFRSIPYEYRINPNSAERKILIVTPKTACELEYLEFQNWAGGTAFIKRENEDPVAIAKVIQPVLGIGRFIGSEYISRPGVVRANHAGVLDIGTTDYQLDRKNIPPGTDLNSLRGGFQVVPSHHYQDRSMKSGGDHPFVFMVVGPLQDPVDLKRYDRGVDGSYPLFQQGMRGGAGITHVKFRGDNAWYEMNQAIKLGKFKSNGKSVYHLRNVIKDVMKDVTHIRVYDAY